MAKKQFPQNETITLVLPHFDQRPALSLFLVPRDEPDPAAGAEIYQSLTSPEECPPKLPCSPGDLSDLMNIMVIALGEKLEDELQRVLPLWLGRSGRAWPSIIRRSFNAFPSMARHLAAYFRSRYGDHALASRALPDPEQVAALFRWFTTLRKEYALSLKPNEQGLTGWHLVAERFSEHQLRLEYMAEMWMQIVMLKKPIPCAYAGIAAMSLDLARFVKAEYGPAQ